MEHTDKLWSNIVLHLAANDVLAVMAVQVSQLLINSILLANSVSSSA